MEHHAAYQKIKDKLSDRYWRLNNLYFITDKTGTKVRFKMNWEQERLYWDMHYLNIVLKARQRGSTTFIALIELDACLFNNDVQAGIIAHTLTDGNKIFKNKVKFAYDNLPNWLKQARPATQDSAGVLSFSNGSSISVGTSMRGGTLQYLLVSEHGKICARWPHKAKEIRTGALNAVEVGQFIWLESTAEGQAGDFFEFTQIARNKLRAGTLLTAMDYRFHFFPWWRAVEYRLDAVGVAIPSDMRDYFLDLAENHQIILDAQQKAWYVKKAETQKDEMKREYPSHPDEAFEAAIEGAYFGKQMAKARTEKRITRVHWEPTIPVNTFWDLGMDDSLTIWFHQQVGMQDRFIKAIMGSGEDFPFYVRILNGLPYVYGRHYLPHDVNVRILGGHDSQPAMGDDGKPRTRKGTLEKLGVKPIIVVSRCSSKLEAIDMGRRALASCWFDEEECAEGIKGLEGFRKAWDENLGVWKSYPVHDEASHWADGFLQFAQGYREDQGGKGRTFMADTNFSV